MKIGITLRTSRDPGTGEIRDAIDRDWWRFLSQALPGDIVLPIPNHPAGAIPFLHATRLDGLVLTGGDDIGSSPERDGTEGALLDACRERGLPVLGICRGLQFLSHRHGADIVPCDPDLHRAVRHPLWMDPDLAPKSARSLVDGNSFHNFRIELDPAGPLRAWAWSPDGCVEGVVSTDRRLLGIGWHPEREHPFRPEDLALFREHFHGEQP